MERPPASGLTCVGAVATATRFTQACTTDLPLAGGFSLSASLDLAPSVDAALRSIMDAADLEASISAPATVVQDKAEARSVTLTNHGPDAAYGRLRFVVAHGPPATFFSLAGLDCIGPVLNIAGTGFTYSCCRSVRGRQKHRLWRHSTSGRVRPPAA